jgi:prevent-host-death family protein
LFPREGHDDHHVLEPRIQPEYRPRQARRRHGPVIITDRGEPSYVLLRHDAYRRLTGGGPTIRELLDQSGLEDIEFDPPPRRRSIG